MSHHISQQERERRQRRKDKCKELLAVMNNLLNSADRAVDNDDYKNLEEHLEDLPIKKIDLMYEISLLWNQPFLEWYIDMRNLDSFMDAAIDRVRRFLVARENNENMTDKEKRQIKEAIRIIRQNKEEFEKEEMNPFDILY